MNLPNAVNAPRALVLGGTTYRARSLTLAQIGEVLAWLEDRAGGPMLFSSQASRIALATTEGLALLLHLACEHHHPSMTRENALELAAKMNASDEQALHAIAFRRQPSKPTNEGGRPPKDLAEYNWGETFAWLTQHTAAGYSAMASLTLDQYSNLACRGEGWDLDELDPREVQAMWEAAQKAEETTSGTN